MAAMLTILKMVGFHVKHIPHIHTGYIYIYTYIHTHTHTHTHPHTQKL